MPITLNNSNISIQYNTGSNYIIDTVKSDIYIINQREQIVNNIITNNLQTAPVTPTTYVDNSGNVYAVESYTYSGSANTKDYTRVFPKNTTCDILIVGGGGGGARRMGGGGGAGALIFYPNYTFTSGSYNIKIGKGGDGSSVAGNINTVSNLENKRGKNGSDSEIILETSVLFRAKGGGGGLGGNTSYANPSELTAIDGGSGGGNGGKDNAHGGLLSTTNIVLSNTVSVLYNTYNRNALTPKYDSLFCYGNEGGIGGGDNPWYGSGGGGAGQRGRDVDTINTIATANDMVGLGGNGLCEVNISGTIYNFATIFGNNTNVIGGELSGGNIYYAGGGGGGSANYNDNTSPYYNSGGLGGGGRSGTKTVVPQSGIERTGGGGGGDGLDVYGGGSGGSGIVIIRYLLGNVNYLTPEPSIILPTFTESIRTFIHSGGAEAQTSYNITVGQNTICDILIVGGGGAGGTYIGGGGGGGGVLYITNCTIPVGTYNIQVGKGGTGVSGGASGTTAQNGSSSKAFGIEVFGGGYGGVGQWGTSAVSQLGANGGSGGGGGSAFNVTPGTGGTVIQPSFTSSVITVNNYNYYGGNGASGILYNNNSFGSVGANGGGGAGGNAPSNTDQINAGAGADGIAINITGTSYFWGGGGGGGQYGGTANGKAGNGGKGGGGGGSGSQVPDQVGIGGIGGITLGQDGDLEGDGTPTAGNGGAGTGGGGGGCGRTTISPNAVSGSGGSGIVIIKFKSTTTISEGNPITHKRLNFTYSPNYPIIQADSTNLKAWYKFDGNYNDSSPSGFNLTNSGAAIVDGLIVQSVSTDSNDFLQTSGINLNGKTYSISFWLKLNTTLTTTNNYFFSQGATESPGLALHFLYESANNLRFSHWGGGNDIDTTGYNMTNVIGTSWHHYVVTYNNTNRAGEIWFDGVKLNTNISTFANTFSGSGNFIIARSSIYGGTFNGLMEDFRYYDKVLISTEITQLYNIPTTNQYTLNFPVPTVADINNNSNIVLRGAYDISLSTTSSLIIPKAGQYIPRPTTFATSNMSIRYNLLSPTPDPIGAQWTYNSSNTSVYHMGSVGIGTTNPEYQLDVRGNIYSSTGGFTQSGLTTWTVLSDRRIKENVVKASYEKCLENVKNIELYNFNFKDNYVSTNDRHQLGFIAQEVQAVYPKAVEVGKIILNLEEKIDDLLTLNTTQIDYTLYGAVKGLIQKMENIKIKIEQIKGTSNITT